MAGQRMTRDAFDAAVQKKMKRFHVSMDQAISETLREVEGPFPARRSVNDIDSYRDNPRYSMHDHPHGSADRNWDMEMRRDNTSNQSYLDEFERDRWGPNDPIAKERLYREGLNTGNRHLGELGNLRPLNREEFPSRDLSLSRRSWELHRPVRDQELAAGQSEGFGDLRSQSQLHPTKHMFKSQGSMGQMPLKQREKKGPIPSLVQNFVGRPSVPYTTQEDSKSQPSGIDNSQIAKIGLQITKWANFNSGEDDLDIAKDKNLLKMNSVSCKMLVNCFKTPLVAYQRELCFASVKEHAACFTLKSPRIDGELLNLLVAKKTVTDKNDFFEAIKPLDYELMLIQQRMLKCVMPLLLASSAFELKYSLLTDSRKVFSALKNTVSLCQKSIVLLGQTFALITSTRQYNVLNVLGVQDPSLKPYEYPNYHNRFLFGTKFMAQLKAWLNQKEHKMTLKSTAKLTDDTNIAKKEEIKTNAESQERKAADPKVVSAIDQLLENAKKGNQAAGKKSEFWFLFDQGSNEYKYYRQKFEELQKAKGLINTQETQTKTCKRSPEELACESVRAMLYARKVQKVKRRLYRSLAFSRKRKQAKLKSRETTTSPDKGEEMIKEEKQELEIAPEKETPTETSACKVDVQLEKTPEKCSASDDTDAKDKELLEDKDQTAAAAPDVDEKTADTAIKLAQFVVQMGPEIEQFSMENSVNNPEFWFLCDKESPAYKFYKSKVEEFKQEEAEGTSDEEIGLEDTDLENIRTGDEPQNDSDGEMDAECEAAEAPTSESTQVAAFSQMPTPVRPPIARKRVANLKVGMLPPKRVCLVEEPKSKNE